MRVGQVEDSRQARSENVSRKEREWLEQPHGNTGSPEERARYTDAKSEVGPVTEKKIAEWQAQLDRQARSGLT